MSVCVSGVVTEAKAEDRDSVMLNFIVSLTVSVPDTWSNSVLAVSVRVCPGESHFDLVDR